MIDVPERTKMQEAIILLLKNKLTWDEFDDYYSNLETKDLAVYEIGWYFWVAMDPEYPSNKPYIKKGIIFRSILFLLSTCEYTRKSRDEEYWPFAEKINYSAECKKMEVI